MPWERPGDKFGTSQGHPGRLGRFMWKFTFKGQDVRGTDATDDGTDGTCPRDRRDTNQGVSRQNSLCLLYCFFFPQTLNDFPNVPASSLCACKCHANHGMGGGKLLPIRLVLKFIIFWCSLWVVCACVCV